MCHDLNIYRKLQQSPSFLSSKLGVSDMLKLDHRHGGRKRSANHNRDDGMTHLISGPGKGNYAGTSH